MATIRTGRASLGILDHIRVDYYGTPTPLNQLANLHVPEPSLITIQPWDVSQIGRSKEPFASPTLASTQPTTARLSLPSTPQGVQGQGGRLADYLRISSRRITSR